MQTHYFYPVKRKILNTDEYEPLLKHLPEASHEEVKKLIAQAKNLSIYISPKRKTKLGDFRVMRSGSYRISVNEDLNPYLFLLTFIHEWAHYEVRKQYGFPGPRPHGEEWKSKMRELMVPFLNDKVFPEELLFYIIRYLKHLRATSYSDTALQYMMRKYGEKNRDKMLFELKKGAVFLFNEKKYKLGDKRRTRYICTNLTNGRKYTLHQNAKVIPLEDQEQ